MKKRIVALERKYAEILAEIKALEAIVLKRKRRPRSLTMKTRAFFFSFVFFLFAPFLCSNTLAAAESKSMTPEEAISQLTPLEGYPKSPLPPTDKTIAPPLPQTPTVPPSVPENHGAFNPRTGEHYPPSGKGVFNPATGEYYPPSGNGYFNPQTGEYYPRVDH